ncbi:MAG: ribonuclease HII [Candidatus Buchananbacteria bacterium]
MKKLNGAKEKELILAGYINVVGIDEAGRGSWAGPVVAGAVRFDSDLKLIKGINDSKKISPKQRDIFYELLIKNFDYGVGIIDCKIIDKINIANAGKMAMIEAVKKLKYAPDYLLIDAFKINYPLPQENIIKGDQKIWCIAAASIIAKVYRDRLMIKLAEKFPNYSFEKHKGYGTAKHLEALKKYGVCDIHRRRYKPIRLLSLPNITQRIDG